MLILVEGVGLAGEAQAKSWVSAITFRVSQTCFHLIYRHLSLSAQIPSSDSFTRYKPLSIPIILSESRMAAPQLHKASALPTFALMPGAWHSPSHFDPVTSRLRSAGYSTQSLRLPSVGSPNPEEVSTTTDADFIIKNVLQPLVGSGTDVVLVMHSYGSIPGTAAAVGISKAERAAAGLPGGIIGIILIAAFIVREGGRCLSGDYPDWAVNNVCLICDLLRAIHP